MNFEDQYIDYLIENIKSIDTMLLDSYFLNKIDFDKLVESIDVTKYNIMSYTTFIKSKKIDNLLS